MSKRLLFSSFLILLIMIGTACIPFLKNNVNNNNNNGQTSLDVSSPGGIITGFVFLPPTTVPTLGSIRGQISNFIGFTASLIDGTNLLQSVQMDASGNFRFNNVPPKAGYKILVRKNRIELMAYTEKSFLPGESISVEVNTSTTARAMVFESLRGTNPTLTINQITAAMVSTLTATLDQVLANPNNAFQTPTQTILSLPLVVKVLASTVSSVELQIRGTSGTTTISRPFAVFSINNGSEKTNSRNVTLNISNILGTGNLFMSIDGTSFEPLRQDKLYTLSTGDGEKTVSVVIMDEKGSISGSFEDTIILDTQSPTVISTNPLNGNTNAGVNITISVTFNEAVINADTGNFIVASGSTTLTGVYSRAGSTVIFTPHINLGYETEYKVILTTGLKDEAGNSLATNFTFAFKTGKAPDTSPPSVVLTVPANGDSNINRKLAQIKVTFNEPIDITSVNITSFGVSGGITGSYVSNGNDVLMTLTNGPLLASETYLVTLTSGIKDLAGNALADSLLNIFSFTTDGTNPRVVPPTIPADGETRVSTGTTKIIVNFSEAIDSTTVSTTTFTINNGAGGTYTVKDKTATLDITTGPLITGIYNVELTGGITDISGNALASSTNNKFSFVSDGLAPLVQFPGIPASGATNVDIQLASITLTFNEPLDIRTVDNTTLLIIASGTKTPLGIYTVSGNNVHFTFSNLPLLGSTTYSVGLTSGLKDLAGNGLGNPATYTFQTDNIRPTPQFPSTPASGSFNVDTALSSIVIPFSEPIAPGTLNPTSIPISGGLAGNYRTSGNSVIFDITSGPLAPGVIYNVTLTTLITDLGGNPLAATTTFQFTTDSSNPLVIFPSNPASGSVNVSTLLSQIKVTFSEPIRPGSLNSTNFSVAGTGISGNLTNSGNDVIFTITSGRLASNSTYLVTLTNGLQDVGGNPLLNPTTFSFTTDGTQPNIVFPTSPASGTFNVVTSLTQIQVPFSEPIDPGTLNAATFAVSGGLLGNYSTSGNNALFQITSGQLATNTTFFVTLTNGIRDFSDNPISNPTTFSFTTDNSQPLIVQAVSPASGSVNVRTDLSTISVRFSEPIDPGTLNSTNFIVSNGVTGSFSISGNDVTFTRSSGTLSTGTTYLVTLGAGLRDVAGNGIASPTTFSFTTDGTAPFVVLPTIPANGATGVSTSLATLTVNFSEPINPATVDLNNFSISNGILGNFSFAGNGVNLSITNGPLATATLYSVTLNQGIKDFSGNSLATSTNNLFSFQTLGENGVNWESTIPVNQFSRRRGHGSVNFGGKMWVIGGNESGTLKNDVYSSVDGAAWTLEQAAAAFAARASHTTVVFNNNMWVIGGFTGVNASDVFFSSDGITWTPATTTAAFGPRSNHSSVVFDNGSGDQMWVVGGGNNTASATDEMWSSFDGIRWTLAAQGTGVGPHQKSSLTVKGNKMYLIGGNDGAGIPGVTLDNVHSSPNGVNWATETFAAAFNQREDHVTLLHNNQIYLIGGTDGTNTFNDVWKSSDGANWNLVTATTSFLPRMSHSGVVFNPGTGDQMYIFGGASDTAGLSHLNDVWTSR